MSRARKYITHITKNGRMAIRSPWGDPRESDSRRTGVMLAGLVLLLMVGLPLTPLDEALRGRLALPVLFWARHKLGRDPTMDKRLVVYSFDDKVLKSIEREDLRLEEWAGVLESFREAKPRAVFIDKIFGTPLGIEAAEAFVERVRKLPFPVVASGFVTEHELPLSRPLSLASEAYDLRKMACDGASSSTEWLPAAKGAAYGAHARVTGAFARVGHIHYSGNHFVTTLVRVGEDRAMRSAAIFLSDDFCIGKQSIAVDGAHVPTDSEGRVLVNFAHPKTYSRINRTLRKVIEGVPKREQVRGLPADAVVLILPAMYTGNTDMAQTPFGVMPGGFVHVSLANSVLTGQWAVVARWNWAYVLICCLGGAILGIYSSYRRFYFSMAVTLLGILGLGILAFSYRTIEIPWLQCMISALLSGLATAIPKFSAAEQRTRRLKDLLEGSVPADQLRRILAHPSHLALEPTEKTVTMVFVDIVGFSSAVEQLTPVQALHDLKEVLAPVTEAVLNAGGVVDRTLGDGILAYFGYSLAGEEASSPHPDIALNCAIAIQRENAARNLARVAEKRMPYPLRIGINTGKVHIIDVGNRRRIDITIVGKGVNFAKRLESACERDHILMSRATRDGITAMAAGVAIARRDILIKHHSERVEAYECNPLAREPKVLEAS